jgi:branched-chain amino acid transport system substrate-binding protein
LIGGERQIERRVGLHDHDALDAAGPLTEASYESTDATVDSQIVNLKASGADILFDVAGPKFTAQAIKKTAEIGWKPVHLVNVASSSVGAVLKPAGFDNAKGLLTAGFLKEPTDPTWRNDPGYKEWSVFMDKYFPDNDRTSVYPAYSYLVAQALVQVLKQCGDNLTRENVMKQAANLKHLQFGMLLPGIEINTGPNDYAPIKQMQMQRFNGETYELFGPIMTGDLGH